MTPGGQSALPRIGQRDHRKPDGIAIFRSRGIDPCVGGAAAHRPQRQPPPGTLHAAGESSSRPDLLCVIGRFNVVRGDFIQGFDLPCRRIMQSCVEQLFGVRRIQWLSRRRILALRVIGAQANSSRQPTPLPQPTSSRYELCTWPTSIVFGSHRRKEPAKLFRQFRAQSLRNLPRRDHSTSC